MTDRIITACGHPALMVHRHCCWCNRCGWVEMFERVSEKVREDAWRGKVV